VDYLSRGAGYSLFLTPGEAVLSLNGPSAAQARASEQAPGASSFHVLRMQVVGSATGAAKAIGERRQGGVVNYLRGSDPGKWRRNVPLFGRVRYPAAYPGIDLVYYGTGGTDSGAGKDAASDPRQLEYDFEVAPGADPSRIRLHFAGAEKLSVNAAGDLVVRLPGTDATLVQKAPFAYQTDKAGQRAPVPVRYRFLVAAGSAGSARSSGSEASESAVPDIGFSLGEYDRSRPLVIDPVLSYSAVVDAQDLEWASAVAVDASGRAVLVGSTGSSNFPTGGSGGGSYQPGQGSYPHDAFVAKLNAAGTGLVYATYLGGDGNDRAWSVALDANGTPWVAGETASTDMPVTSTGHRTSRYGGTGSDAFAIRLSADGTQLLYGTYLGGAGVDVARAVALDGNGRAYVAGETTSADYPVTPGAFQAAAPGGPAGSDKNGFVTKIDTSATANNGLGYSTYLGGASTSNGTAPDDGVLAIAVDPATGAAYVAGRTASPDFPTTAGALRTGASVPTLGICDGFAAKLNATGTALVYGTLLGGDDYDDARGIALATDGSGAAYVVGVTSSGPPYPRTFPVTAGAYQTTIGGTSDAFVAKVNATGTGLVSGTYLGGSGGERANAVAVDAATGAVYVAGETGSADFPTTAGALAGSSTVGATYLDAFVAKLPADLGTLSYGSRLGGDAVEQAYGIAVDSGGAAYVTGYTEAGDFPTTAGAYQPSGTWGRAAFVSKFDLGSGATPTLTLGGVSNNILTGHTTPGATVVIEILDADGNVIAVITVVADANGNFSVDLGQLPGGSYVGRVTVPGSGVGAPIVGTTPVVIGGGNAPEPGAMYVPWLSDLRYGGDQPADRVAQLSWVYPPPVSGPPSGPPGAGQPTTAGGGIAYEYLARDGAGVFGMNGSTTSYDDHGWSFNTRHAYTIVGTSTSYSWNGSGWVTHVERWESQPCFVTVRKVVASAHQTVDSRIDMRFSDYHLKDFKFKDTLYRGGLFAGYNADGARAARTYFKFTGLTGPAAGNTGEKLWPVGGLSAYSTRLAKAGSASLICRSAASSAWDPAELVWSNMPALRTPAVAGGSPPALTINWGGAPGSAGQWVTVNNMAEIQRALVEAGGTGGAAAAALTSVVLSPNETGSGANVIASQSGWAYFARSQYTANGQTFPTVLIYAFGGNGVPVSTGGWTNTSSVTNRVNTAAVGVKK
jgi:hypothetical protein